MRDVVMLGMQSAILQKNIMCIHKFFECIKIKQPPVFNIMRTAAELCCSCARPRLFSHKCNARSVSVRRSTVT